jgi:ribosomal protein L37AE/L43A
MTDVLALDLATVTGWARGHVGTTPKYGSVRFLRYHGARDNVIFAEALRWISQLLEPQPRPDVVIIEAMLPPEAMKGQTSRAVRDRLAGLHGVMRGVAHLRGVKEIATASVGDIRAHFIGERTATRKNAKLWTVNKCRELGWMPENDNAADALALWHFACSTIDPRLAIEVSPLFRRAAG